MKNHLKPTATILALMAGLTWSCQDIHESTPVALEQDLVTHFTQRIPNEYIIRLKPNEINFRKSGDYAANQAAMRKYSESLLASHRVAPSQIRMTYSAAIDGFAAHLSEEQVNSLRKDSRILIIEEDEWIHLDGAASKGGGKGGTTTKGPKSYPTEPAPTEPTPTEPSEPTPTEPEPSQPTPSDPTPSPEPSPSIDYGPETSDPNQEVPWGIQRIGGFSTYKGTNVAFVIDSGIDLDHPDLNVLASLGFRAVTDDISTTLDDENSHGTHVAGTIAAINNNFGVVGVAAGAPVVPVKVLGPTGSGKKSWSIAGIDYVAGVGKPGDVANLSLGGSPSTIQDEAVLNAAAKGIFMVIAAMNNADLASNYSPARVNGTNVFTISSMDSNGALSSFSNYGNPPVDYAAPGRSVRSTMPGGGYGSKSGTSMATPHVSGILLLKGVRTNGFITGDKDSQPDPIAYRADR
ncbi:subtilisin family serine protease [Algoriphagus aquaeductus]|uniref:Subtilisin family serine protease n=1 Tax=Algoriphagus aquaeductus TaxID=475299 RepID=A0A326S3X1_9BACT|nr:S8 family serine peptidase [Algoriphagus aquaeductus]PZV86153.1 subtilisin family serine protease [Algoriphagus aquaeductus]